MNTTYNATVSLDVSGRSLSDNEMLLGGIAFGVVWNFGFVANVITLMELCRIQQTPLNVIIMGLCCSDIISILVSPFLVKQIFSRSVNEDYPWNRLLCKTLFPVQNITSAVTILLVLALSNWRLYAIQKPNKAIGFMSVRTAKRLVISVWLTVATLTLSLGSLYLDIVPSDRDNKQTCFIKDSTQVIAYVSHFINTVLFTILPVSLIVIMCISVAASLFRKKIKRQELTGDQEFRRGEKNALIQLSAIVSSFLVGYIPKVAYSIWTVAGPRSHRSVALAYLATLWIVNCTESINPIIYNIGSKDLWKSVKNNMKPSNCNCTAFRKQQVTVARTENPKTTKKEHQETPV